MAVESSESIVYSICVIVHNLFFPPKLLRVGGREGGRQRGELWLAWPPSSIPFLLRVIQSTMFSLLWTHSGVAYTKNEGL
jgi:hypothetical protein